MMRSGSTLLGRLLAELPNAVNVGELSHILSPDFRDTTLCGCGKPVMQCAFWQEVFARAFGGLNHLDLQALHQVKETHRFRNLPRMLLSQNTIAQNHQFQYYIRNLDSLYQAVAEVTGARVIVDVSKHATFGYMLAQYVPSLDIRSVHLIRDSRAVAYSQQRVKTDPASVAHPGQLPIISPLKTAFLWNGTNGLLNIKKIGRHSLALRYEDMVADPSGAISALWKLMEEPDPSVSFLEQTSLCLHTSHTMAGNPDRWQSTIRISLDNEWEGKMKRSQRLLVTALTLPLLLQYGYLSRLPLSTLRKSIAQTGVL